MNFIKIPKYGLLNIDAIERVTIKETHKKNFYLIDIYFISGKILELNFKTEKDRNNFYSFLSQKNHLEFQEKYMKWIEEIIEKIEKAQIIYQII